MFFKVWFMDHLHWNQSLGELIKSKDSCILHLTSRMRILAVGAQDICLIGKPNMILPHLKSETHYLEGTRFDWNIR